MGYLHIHSKEELFPTTHSVNHGGYWPLLLDDGTYFITIRTGDIGVTKHIITQAANLHPEAGVTIIPSIRSGKNIEPTALASFNTHLDLKNAHMNGQDVLAAMFERHGNPIYDPDATI